MDYKERHRAIHRKASAKYRRSAKGRAFARKQAQRRRVDQEYIERLRALARVKYTRHKAAILAANKRWRETTDKGKLHSLLRKHHLLSGTPECVIRSCELLQTLKKGMRHEHNPA